MPEYLAPGVYPEEVSLRPKSIEGVGTSTTGFVGMTGRGPTGITPPLLTCFADFELYYGGLDNLSIGGKSATNYLAHGARAFFDNGGSRLYVARVLGANAKPGGVLINTDAADEDHKVTFAARTPGGAADPVTHANFSVQLALSKLATTKALAMRQDPGTLVNSGADYFVMGTDPLKTTAGDNGAAFKALDDKAQVSIVTLSAVMRDASGAVVAEYAGLGLDPAHARYAGLVLGPTPPNTRDALTNPVVLNLGSKVDTFGLRAAIEKGSGTYALSGGSDGDGPPADTDWDNALNLLLGLEDISIIAAPGSSSFERATSDSINQKLIGSAETRRAYRIAVLDTPPSMEPNDVRDLKSALDSKYAALYYPWIVVANPLASTDPTQPSTIALPPSGFVCGIYARTDIQRGVFKPPANETVTGAIGLQRDVRFGEQEVLNPLGINCIRSLPNRGFRVWGARTLSSDPDWTYVNVRRYFLYLEASIDQSSQWAVFEPNGPPLWRQVRGAIIDFLRNEWISGALIGATPKEAFYVLCDRSTTMSQNDLDNGRMICEIGVVVVKPAEFVIFRIGQTTIGARD
ncbi:phage tail sheath family protein [Paraburkholderia atlantica]|uniref:phage tail sheath family protein n=1 Tax=Paraburkholderia atlantica TaxID=2654982 RepID=UPI003D22EF74